MKGGYTLIEIMIVIAVSAILFTIGYTTFKSYSDQQALLQTARSIQADLKTAQESAIAGNKPADCSGTLNGYEFNRTSVNNYEIDILCSGGNIHGPSKSLLSGIIMSSISRNPTVFKPLAQGTNIPSGNTTVITLRQASTGNTKTITIGADGNIQ